MTRNEIIRLYCQLREAVAEILEEEQPDKIARARDCFCSNAPHFVTDFQDEVFAFIRSCISVRLESEGHGLGDKFNKRLSDIISYDNRRESDVRKRGHA